MSRIYLLNIVLEYLERTKKKYRFMSIIVIEYFYDYAPYERRSVHIEMSSLSSKLIAL